MESHPSRNEGETQAANFCIAVTGKRSSAAQTQPYLTAALFL